MGWKNLSKKAKIGIVIGLSVGIIILALFLMLFFLLGGGIHKDSEFPVFNFDKKYLEQKQEIYFGIHMRGILFSGSVKEKWIVLESKNVKVSENCFVTYNKYVIQNGYDGPYLITCDINRDICIGSCGIESGRHTKESLINMGFITLPNEENPRVLI
tara:strand:+ start:714 stop:1184 length:471 start_codon:yes stop_codon:yes gene_type:complete